MKRWILALVALSTLPAWGQVKPVMEVTPTQPTPGQNTTLKFRVEQDGAALIDYDVVHEKKAHLIVVSADYRDFQHLHPVLDKQGTFTEQTMQFAQGGLYYVFLDVTPEGSDQVLHRFDLDVKGQGHKLVLEPDLAPKMIGPVKVELEAMPARITTGDAMLHFRLSENGQAVQDIEPFLGAMGHVVALGDEGKPFLHVHPMGGHDMMNHGNMPAMEHAPAAPGEVVFHATFPSPGLYRVWGQFQRGGQMIIAPFTVEVHPR